MLSIFIQICKISPIHMGLSVCVCLSVYYNHEHGSYLNENKKCKKWRFCRHWHLPSNGAIAKIVLHDLDLLFKVKTFESRPSHSVELPFKCDECEYCCTHSRSLSRHMLTHISKCQFKCNEWEFKCDKGDICNKTNHHLTRHKHGHHINIALPDSAPFV